MWIKIIWFTWLLLLLWQRVFQIMTTIMQIITKKTAAEIIGTHSFSSCSE